MKKSLFILLGFVLFSLGLTALILQMLGLHFIFLNFLNGLPFYIRSIVFVILTFGGMIMLYLHATNWRDDIPDRDSTPN